MPARVRSICLVAGEFDLVQRNGGIGTYNRLAAEVLRAAGLHVHVLYCGPDPGGHALQAVNLHLRRNGIGFNWIGDIDLPPEHAAPGHFRHFHVELSDRVRVVLEELHRRYRFDLIEFAEYGALGFRSVQARRCGSGLCDVRLMVKLHSSSQWMRDGNGHWPVDETDLQLDYCERYAFDHADIQAAPSRSMLDYARSVGWNVRPDAMCIRNPIVPVGFTRSVPLDGVPELVFFGRLETRKGLEIFLDAVARLPSDVPITFLGRENVLSGGEAALDVIRRRLKDRPHTIMSNCTREEALAHLTTGHRLAVMPSLRDNHPYTLLECLQARVPFVVSNVGGVPDILTDEEARRHLAFEPTSRDLLHRLTDYLGASSQEREERLCRAMQCLDVAAENRRFVENYREIIDRVPAAKDVPAVEPALVSIVVPHFNMAQYLPDALASLAAQTWPRIDVIVIDDGSDDPESQRVFEQMRERHPHFRFLTQENAGIGATRNRGLAEAQGEFFVCMDADNIAKPTMIERLVHGMRHRPDCSTLTCWYLAFADNNALRHGRYDFAFHPAGGPHVLGAIRNVYGDATAIHRTADFRAVGGFETDRGTSFEDWEVFVKLVNHGKRVDVLPEHLLYYRHLPTGFSRVTNEYRNRQRVLRQYRDPAELPLAERLALWQALAGFHVRIGQLIEFRGLLRYRLADRINNWLKRIPGAHGLARRAYSLVRNLRRRWKGLPPIEATPIDDTPTTVAGLVQPPPESPLEYHGCIPGWFDYEDIYDAAIRRARDGAVFVEVGAYLGRSTIYLASRIKQSGKKIRLYVVDLWDGWFHADYAPQTPMREEGDVFKHFWRHVCAARVDDVVVPLKLSSIRAARLFDRETLDFVFLDADHSEKAVTDDLEAWYPLVKPGGSIGVHDYANETFPGVEPAVDRFLEREGLKGSPSRGVGMWTRKPRRATRTATDAGHEIPGLVKPH